jgi:hypothetical protein
MNKMVPTRVADSGLTALIDRLGRDCSPTQYIREFIRNSIEAIQRTKKPGKILVDANWDFLDQGLTDVYKISFTDTGDGMSGEEMVEYLNQLSATGNLNGEFENYGIGAKIAAMSRNKCGIFYESWKEKKGYATSISLDEKSRRYGMPENEEGLPYYQLNPKRIPSIIAEHGTRVTLFGNTVDQDTMLPPEGITGSKEAWIIYQINSRFYVIPENMEILCRVGYYRDRTDTKHNFLLRAKGQKDFLDTNSVAAGFVSIPNAKVLWWILSEDADGHGRNFDKGHVAVIHQSEIFDRVDSRNNRAALFGIILGARRVVIYVEPDQRLFTQNVQRTHLIQPSGEPVPWEEWGVDFKKVMPKELADFIQAERQKIVTRTDEESIRNRLKKYAALFKVSKYKPTPSGNVVVDPQQISQGLTGHNLQGEGSGGGGGGGGSSSGVTKTILSLLRDEAGVKAKEVRPDPFPNFMWVSLTENTRDSDDGMEDRAARYYEGENLIKGNKDFQGYRDIVEYFSKMYEGGEFQEALVEAVYEYFQQQLIETVAGVLSLRGRKYWNYDQCKMAWSDEALTASVCCRYHILEAVDRQLSKSFSTGIKRAS